MATEIKLPDLGDGIDSGDVLEVLVKEGDTVEKDQGIVELETDKATVEVPSTHAGRVTKVHVKAGQSVPIGATLISVEIEAAAAKPAEKKSPEPAAEAPQVQEKRPAKEPPKREQAEPAKPASKAPSKEQPEEPEEEQPAVKTAEKPPPARPAPARPAAAISRGASPENIAASPAVRRFAREVGVDLSLVKPTGEGGRITRDDVLEVVRQANQRVRSGATRTPSAEGKSLPGEISQDEWGPVRFDRMPKIRKTIANKMFESWSTVPRVTNFDDADVTELEKIRQTSKEDYAARGIRLTSMPFVVKAVAMALQSHPLVNASVDTESNQIIYKDYVNIGIAVDSERGLVVPSLRNADQLTIPEIARSLATLADNVRTNNFAIEDLRGSTFTISNMGAIGGSYSTPIINTPEVAILLVGRSRKLPVVIDDNIVVRLIMPLSLSFDHRLVDGAVAARFLNDVIGYLKAPGRLLLAP